MQAVRDHRSEKGIELGVQGRRGLGLSVFIAGLLSVVLVV